MSFKTKVLFVCSHNSARSQMAEAILNHIAGDRFEAMSAGTDPGTINPLAIQVMNEIGLDISRNETKRVFDLYRAGKMFRYVIAVCDKEVAEKCPIFPGICERLEWPFPDPSKSEGSRDERLTIARGVRDQIEAKIREFVETQTAGSEV
jgi:arsenate reductase